MFLPNKLRGLVLAAALLGCSAVAVQADEPKAEPPKAEQAATASVTKEVLSTVYFDLAFAIAETNQLGLEVTDPEAALRSQLDLPLDQGLVVSNVAAESAAATAGIRQNDVLLTINGQAIGSVDSFVKSLNELGAADTEAKKQPAKMMLLRGGKKINVEVSREIPESKRLVGELLYLSAAESQKYWIGVAVADIDATLRAQLNLPDKQGLVVTEVKPESAAEKAGVKVHDVLLEYNEKSLTTTDDLRNVVEELGKDGKNGSMKLLRGGKPATLTVTPVEKKRDLATVKTPLNYVNLDIGTDTTQFWSTRVGHGLRITTDAPQPTVLMPYSIGMSRNTTQAQAATPADDQFKVLLEAIQQLSKKVDSLEQAVKKSEGAKSN